ncbi:MAG TPA: glycoside hydrolase family 88 protein [Vicinamibacterales bacterium]|nr:glycoside hydrolase family 88 protein [Vicinamibacterales bacterium]
MLSVLIASAVAASLASDLQAIAKLPGEPSIVSAAGLDANGEPVLTLENPSAFDPRSQKKRIVIFAAGGSDQRASAVLRLLRWVKASAPARVRDAWVASALPSAVFADTASFPRWLEFQNADAAFEVTDAAKTPEDLLRVLNGVTKPSAPMRAKVARDPMTIAKLLAAKYPVEPAISYIPSLSWANTLKLAANTDDAALRAKVEQQIRPWKSGEKDLFGNRIQLTAVAGTLVFADLARTGDEAARALAVKGAEAASKVKEGDLYEYGGGWTDDMFMASVVLARTSSLPGRSGDLDLAGKMLIAYAGRLQRPDGIFVHATNGPFAWGRGNGFAALGLTETLTAMPPNHPLRSKVLDIYTRQMEALRAQQAPDGMWREVIDEPGSYREESATAIIMTAMARGVRLGWLDKAYSQVAQRAWHALAAHVAEDGTIIDVCTSTGSGPTKKYYLERAAITGADDRGGAMALMAAMEMLN